MDDAFKAIRDGVRLKPVTESKKNDGREQMHSVSKNPLMSQLSREVEKIREATADSEEDDENIYYNWGKTS